MLFSMFEDNSFSTNLRSYLGRRFILEDIDKDRTQSKFVNGVNMYFIYWCSGNFVKYISLSDL